jgi:hypothetical protein
MRTYLLACAFLAGCNVPTDISGIYQSSTHTQNTAGCGPGPSVGDMPIFRIERIDVLGTVGYTYEICAATDPMSCLDFGLLSLRFTQPIAGGWTDDTYEGNFNQFCALTHTVSTAIRSGNTINVEFKTFSMMGSAAKIMSTSCDAMAAREAASQMPCISDEVEIATRVSGP